MDINTYYIAYGPQKNNQYAYLDWTLYLGR